MARFSPTSTHLRGRFNPDVLPALGCRCGVTVSWDGSLAGLRLQPGCGPRRVTTTAPQTIFDVEFDETGIASISRRRIRFGAALPRVRCRRGLLLKRSAPVTRSGRDHVIMLTRFPVPGTTKRRLGEALGPGGAAMLHRDLAAYCFARMRRWPRREKPRRGPLRRRAEDVPSAHGCTGRHLPRAVDGHLGDRLRSAAAETPSRRAPSASSCSARTAPMREAGVVRAAIAARRPRRGDRPRR